MKIARKCPICKAQPRIVPVRNCVTGKVSGYYVYCQAGVERKTHRIDTVTCKSLAKAIDIWNGDYYEGKVYKDG